MRFADLDRAVLDGEPEDLMGWKVHADRKGRILGATVVANHAGDLIAELVLAMSHGLRLGALGKTIHPDPTQAEAIKQVGDAYNRTRSTPFVRKLLRMSIGLQR